LTTWACVVCETLLHIQGRRWLPGLLCSPCSWLAWHSGFGRCKRRRNQKVEDAEWLLLDPCAACSRHTYPAGSRYTYTAGPPSRFTYTYTTLPYIMAASATTYTWGTWHVRGALQIVTNPALRKKPQRATSAQSGVHARSCIRGNTQMDRWKSRKNALQMRRGSHGTTSALGTSYAATTQANARHARSARAGVSLGAKGSLESRSAAYREC